MNKRIAKAIQERDGLDCFLCGKTHTSLARMSIGFVGTEHTADNAYLACTGCNKRRNNRPLGAYLKQRLNEVRREAMHIESHFDPSNETSRVTRHMWQCLNRPIMISSDGDEEPVENPSLAGDIQDVPWPKIMKMDLPTFESLNKTPASDHEAKLIAAIGRRAMWRSGIEPESGFTILLGYEREASFVCQDTDEQIPCQWDGEKQYIDK